MNIILITIYAILVVAVQLLVVKRLKSANAGQIALVQVIQLIPLVMITFLTTTHDEILPWCAGVFVASSLWMMMSIKPKEDPPEQTEEKSSPKTRSCSNGHDPTFKEIHHWMVSEKKYLEGPLKLSDVSRAMRLPEKTISASINDHAGENFNAYINRLRIKEASRMLQDSTYDFWTIDGIGESVGFTNKVSFYNAFKRIEACSPREFRENR